jgi:hypothetical protein
MVREAVTTGTVNPTGTRVSTVSLNNKTNTNENQVCKLCKYALHIIDQISSCDEN